METVTSDSIPETDHQHTIIIRNLSRQPYEPIWQAMRRFTDQRTRTDIDELWSVEHPPIFTQGQAGKAEHILAPGSIPVLPVDRGGQVTFHGPGQIVIYILIDLERKGFGVRQFVSLIESSIIALLDEYEVEAYADAHAPGVYVEGAKIASLGLRIRKGCSYHGLSLNTDMDLEPFTRINPCGHQGLKVIQLKDLATFDSIDSVKNKLLTQLTRHLAYNRVQDSHLPPNY